MFTRPQGVSQVNRLPSPVRSPLQQPRTHTVLCALLLLMGRPRVALQCASHSLALSMGLNLCYCQLLTVGVVSKGLWRFVNPGAHVHTTPLVIWIMSSVACMLLLLVGPIGWQDIKPLGLMSCLCWVLCLHLESRTYSTYMTVAGQSYAWFMCRGTFVLLDVPKAA